MTALSQKKEREKKKQRNKASKGGWEEGREGRKYNLEFSRHQRPAVAKETGAGCGKLSNRNETGDVHYMMERNIDINIYLSSS